MNLSMTMLHTDALGWPSQARIARAADELGFSRLWVGESFGTDALSELSAYACLTESIGLASGVVGIYSRTPASIAQSVVTLQAVSGGRFTLGLGTSSSVLAEQWHGTSFEGALTRLRETIDVTRLVLSGERLTYQGRFFEFSAGLRLPSVSPGREVPVYVGALAPGGLRLAGEMADGWIATFVSPDDYERVLASRVSEGTQRRSASLGPLRVCVYQLVVPAEDRALVLAAVRPHLARYVGLMGLPEKNYYARLFSDYGFGDEVLRIQDAFRERRREAAEAAVTEEMVDRVTISGSASDCSDGLRKLAALGIDEVALELLTPKRDADAVITAMGEISALAAGWSDGGQVRR